MGERSDEIKGRAKEAFGDLTDDERMQREGKVDQAKSDAKEAANKVTDKIGDTIKRVTD